MKRTTRATLGGGHPHALGLAALLAWLLPWGGIAGQEVTRIGEDAACPATWTLEEESAVGGEEEVGLAGPTEAIYREPGGGVALYVRGRIHLYDSDGGLEHSFGRTGEGPGELGNVQVIRFREEGEVETWDGALRRRTVFGPPPNFEVRDTEPLPLAFGFQALEDPNGRVVMNENMGTADAAGLPLHLVQRDGELIRSFGKEPPGLDPDVAFPLSRKLGWAGDGFEEVWSAHRRAYRVERWSLGGELLGGFVREVPWFEPWDMDPPMSPETPPPPRVADVHEFDRDAVGVLLMLPAEDPSEGMERDGEYWIPTRMDRVVRTRLEVLDPDEGCVRATLDVSGYPVRFLDDGALVVYEEDDLTGSPMLRVLRVARGG